MAAPTIFLWLCKNTGLLFLTKPSNNVEKSSSFKYCFLILCLFLYCQNVFFLYMLCNNAKLWEALENKWNYSLNQAYHACPFYKEHKMPFYPLYALMILMGIGVSHWTGLTLVYPSNVSDKRAFWPTVIMLLRAQCSPLIVSFFNVKGVLPGYIYPWREKGLTLNAKPMIITNWIGSVASFFCFHLHFIIDYL